MWRSRQGAGWWGLCAVCCLALPAAAAKQSASELFPREPAAWINAPPLTAEMLQGKGVVLWFFEEQCPSCRGKWPGMYELAKRYESQPVVFIAVNSGNPRPVVEQYVRGVNLRWPVIVDPTRQLEKQWLDNEISLQNIHQAMLLLPSGSKRPGQWNDLDASVQQALQGAAWRIDPQTIPAVFQPTWRAVEFGLYATAAPLVKKGLVTSNAEVKRAAVQVHDFVQEQIQTAAEEAGRLRQAGQTWEAYQRYGAIAVTFAGYDLPADVAAAPLALREDPQVRTQLEAHKSLDAIKKSIPTIRTDLARKRAIGRLEGLVSQFPDTDAAREAQALLDQAASAP